MIRQRLKEGQQHGQQWLMRWQRQLSRFCGFISVNRLPVFTGGFFIWKGLCRFALQGFYGIYPMMAGRQPCHCHFLFAGK